MNVIFVLLLMLATSTNEPTTNPAPAPAATRPADSAVDYLLGASRKTAATSPATAEPAVPAESAANAQSRTTAPATAAVIASPLLPQQPNLDVRAGTITLSDGVQIAGNISTTPGKPLRVWDEQAGEFRDLPMRSIASVEARVLWEKDEPQWRFKESGSDIKIETGKTYPSRETEYLFTLDDGSTVTGGVVTPLMVKTGDATTTYILHKRDKGDVGRTLADLKYVKRVEFAK